MRGWDALPKPRKPSHVTYSTVALVLAKHHLPPFTSHHTHLRFLPQPCPIHGVINADALTLRYQ